MIAGPTEQVWVSRDPEPASERAYESHVAVGVELPAREVLAVAHAAGWQARVCNRGGLFDVVEVWVENSYLVEVLDPEQLADYRRSMTVENWKRAFPLA